MYKCIYCRYMSNWWGALLQMYCTLSFWQVSVVKMQRLWVCQEMFWKKAVCDSLCSALYLYCVAHTCSINIITHNKLEKYQKIPYS